MEHAWLWQAPGSQNPTRNFEANGLVKSAPSATSGVKGAPERLDRA